MTRSVVFTVLTLLLTVGQASAECAWVLWQEQPVGSNQWRLAHTTQIAFETKNACEFVAKGAFENQARVLEEKAGREDLPALMFFTCLPDTVDPRGAKGGGR